mmetsp:Transcript_25088/g.47986  ORF Transcript_25088/g.47986 Transcript_25088/m.47986 type:complete len:356 (+) Transcript_25088:118-1185(+)
MECFGDSSDDETEEGDTNEGTTTTSSTTIQRDESCGVCSFHPNTEASLLTHVRNTLKSKSSSPSFEDDDDDETNNQLQQSTNVLNAIDEFCMSRHWMMHVGPEKGTILLDSLRHAMKNKTMERKIERGSRSSESDTTIPFVAVELGTYCGYASIVMGRAFRQFQLRCTMKDAIESDEEEGVDDVNGNVNAVNGNGGDVPTKKMMMDCHLITTEINPKCTEIASQMIQLSGLQNVISVRQIHYNGSTTDIVETVRNSLPKHDNNDNNHKIDFLFVDHDKHSYKSDLIQLERSGLIRRGTKVVADNVLFAEIDDYVNYVQRREEEGVVRTKTVRCHVEYSGEEGEDGVEITDYLQDP